MKTQSNHWADLNADKIIREKGDKAQYVCASGVTPSGTVHIGNFREIISVALVVQALREKGKTTRFIYSWDDYDVFRKVPVNMPEQEKLSEYLRKPITMVPDVLGSEKSYAKANEKAVENILPEVGVIPEYIYQADHYRGSKYAKEIRNTLEHMDLIRRLLDEHRTNPLEADWMPVSVFCTKCLKDTTKVTEWDGDWNLTYNCSSCGNNETIDLRKTPAVKLPWRIDWPMRWKREQVDFEPAGKDHHTEGGSFDTAKKIVAEVYGGEAPVTFQYDFIRIKGRGGKISSSSGEVVSLPDVLEIYQPEIVRFMFAGTRPNAEFAISFDLDVLKLYEDYDKCERIYFSPAESEKAKKKKAKQARIYELSQIHEIPKEMPYQIQIRHLCNLLQIMSGDIDKVIALLGDVDETQKPKFRKRAECAWNWVNQYAPEDFKFSLKKGTEPLEDLSDDQRKAIKRLYKEADAKMDKMDEKEFGSVVYDIARECGLDSKDLFPAVYKVIIGKEKGPRLISFLYTIGRERVVELLKGY